MFRKKFRISKERDVKMNMQFQFRSSVVHVAQKFIARFVLFGTFFSSVVSIAEVSSQPSKVLDWRKIESQSLDFSRKPVEGGVGIYTLPEKAARKFRVTFLFATGMYNFPQEQSAEVGATVVNLHLGGAGKRTYEDIVNFVTKLGLGFDVALNGEGRVQLSVEGLSGDFSQAMSLVEDILLHPNFDPQAFEVWKREETDDFNALLDAGSPAKQARFMNYEMNRLTLGENHYLTQTLMRRSPAGLNTIRPANFRNIAGKLLVRTGLNVVLSGGFRDGDVLSVEKLVRKIPQSDVKPEVWLMERPSQNAGSPEKVHVAIIQKTDMAQASAELRILNLNVGKINRTERVDLGILEEVFASSGGVVGNDRWTRAMRAESGLSYSASAQFSEQVLEPNTNFGIWRLIFQSPLPRVPEACALAKKTWDTFVQKGVFAEEMERARTTIMNGRLAREETFVDKAIVFENSIARGDLPNPVSAQSLLARYEAAAGLEERVNRTLNRLAPVRAPMYLVIMGNVDKTSIDKISALPEFEITEVVSFSDLVKQSLISSIS